ncbi:unnamed protein product, partial [Iphiclides podalirius]
MWNMMCDVMPTISEDSISQRSSQFSGEDANFEQLMVSMLDERDKLVESLRETQERLNDSEVRLKDVEKERDSLQRQIAANLPQPVPNTDDNRLIRSFALSFVMCAAKAWTDSPAPVSPSAYYASVFKARADGPLRVCVFITIEDKHCYAKDDAVPLRESRLTIHLLFGRRDWT